MTKARDIANAGTALTTVSATELGYLDGVTSAIQTQLDAKTAKSTLTTTGDIYYASSANTPARLGIGSTSQVLTVAGGVPSWATPSGSAYVFLKKVTLSDVADSGSNFNGIFTSDYPNYAIFMRGNISNGNSNLHFRLKTGTSTIKTTGYTGNSPYVAYNAATWTALSGDDASQCSLSNGFGAQSLVSLIVSTANSVASWTGSAMVRTSGAAVQGHVINWYNQNSDTYTGFDVKMGSGNIWSTIYVYGIKDA